MFWSTAFAQAAGSPAAKPGLLEILFPIIVFLGIFYFMIGRPQQKRLKEHKDFVTKLQRGDQIITSSGILGTVTGITEKVVTLEIADNVRIRVLKTQVAGLAKEGIA
jgi:preprotein translocase subunit YajC